MRILFLNQFFFPYFAGTEKHMYEVGKRLAKEHEVMVLTARLKGTPAEEMISGMHIVRTPATVCDWAPHPIPPPVPIMPRLADDVKKYAAKADLVHIHNRFIFGPKYGSIIKKLGKKLCITLHNARPQGIDFFSDLCGQFYDDLFGKRLMRKCDGIIGVSRNTLETTLPEDYQGKTTVIYNGVDGKLFRPKRSSKWKERIGSDKQIVLTNARLVPQKGVKYLVKAMAGVKDAMLVVLGRGILKNELEEMARKRGVDTLFITEYITEASLVDLYAAADVFVLPSLFEPMPLVLLEAMACGKPIVATAVGGIPELIEDGKNGLLVPPADPAALRKNISVLLSDKYERRRMGKENRKKVVQRFTWDRTAKEVNAFYRALMC